MKQLILRVYVIAVLLVLSGLGIGGYISDTVFAQGEPLQSAGSSSVAPQTLNALQPANSSAVPLQSAGVTGSGADQAASAQTLQQTAPSDQVKLLVQGDGEPPQTSTSQPNLEWLWQILLVMVATCSAGYAVWLLQRHPIR